ncbi:alkaline phosphatase [Novibacillus thermophilus]|uniref:Alkaline phosphatase n=1 Tax=Novibacillus thermophilus TaxID=1471761 RepID=A0A1U9K7G6_9BACL|nr:alkaline phosphatase [Novibacillus thermophilus]
MRKPWSKWLALVVVLAFVFGSFISSVTDSSVMAEPQTARYKGIKNIIVLIGDGMGPSYMTAYRYFKDDPSTRVMESTAFDRHLVGAAKTYSWDEEENITDSAAAATSMAAGIKTYNGAISVDMDKRPVQTVLERAKELGKSTGLVSTSQITHATPAAFGAHDESRNNYDAIADDFYDERIRGKHKIDVMLGGGTDYFIRDDRNLVKLFKRDGYSYVTNRKEMFRTRNDQVLGLFAEVGLPKAIDRPDDVPSLEEMTNFAIERLSKNRKGFFLMVEGSQIDWAGHDNDIVAAMSEMQDFEEAFQAAIDFAKKDGRTLVVATADHSTGGLSIGRDGEYKWDTAPIKQAKRTPEFMAAQIADGADVERTLDEYIAFGLTDDEIQSVKEAEETGDESEIHRAIANIFDERSLTGWTTGGHTGEDVNVYAYGPGKEMFAGLIDNTDIANNIFKIMGKRHR